MAEQMKIPKRILSSLLNSLSAGVVPRIGAAYITIGRTDEVNALLSDLELIKDGGSSIRFIIGKYGSGKSFLLQLIRSYANEKNYVTVDADLSPERKLCGTGGSGLSTYRELVKNMSCKASPDGNALSIIISKWFSDLQIKTAARGISPDSSAFRTALNSEIYEETRKLESQVGGFDFASVLVKYYNAYIDCDEETKSACMRWFRGEYTTKTDAKTALHVSSFINDDNWYDYIKLLALFVKNIGYNGLVMLIDECVNLYKTVNRVSRENNYEKLLSMFNDTLSGNAKGLMIVCGGTPQFLEDSRRGLFSYEALRSRLADPCFSSDEYKNIMGPLIRLRRLSDNELYALIIRITTLHSQNYGWQPRINDEEMLSFLNTCLSRAGSSSLVTPREITRDYISLLNMLYQNENISFNDIMGNNLIKSSVSKDADLENDEFADIEI